MCWLPDSPPTADGPMTVTALAEHAGAVGRHGHAAGRPGASHQGRHGDAARNSGTSRNADAGQSAKAASSWFCGTEAIRTSKRRRAARSPSYTAGTRPRRKPRPRRRRGRGRTRLSRVDAPPPPPPPPPPPDQIIVIRGTQKTVEVVRSRGKVNHGSEQTAVLMLRAAGVAQPPSGFRARRTGRHSIDGRQEHRDRLSG